MREAFFNTLLHEAKLNSSIRLITGDLGFGVIEEFEKELPLQFVNVGIAEQTMVGLAAGIASEGNRVFVYSIGNFPTIRALEQIRNDICYMNNSVVIVSIGSGFSYGNQGYTHHALEDIAVMRVLPNMEICSPADPLETAMITKYLARTTNPAYLRLGRSGEKNINLVEPSFVLEDMNKIMDGKDGALVFTGSIGSNVVKARSELLKRGFSVAVYSVPFISNLKPKALEVLDPNKPVIVVEEHSIRGGLSSSIMELLAITGTRLRIKPLYATQNNLALVGDQTYLREANGLGVDTIVNQFLSW